VQGRMRIRDEWNKVTFKRKVFVVAYFIFLTLAFILAIYFLIRGIPFGSKSFIIITIVVLISIPLWAVADRIVHRVSRIVEESDRKTMAFLLNFLFSLFIGFLIFLIYYLIQNKN
jgi:hydrogenase-4 membrane subunit HyfE